MRRAGGKKSGGFEPADIPSPRTMWSVYNKKEMATFERCHEKLKSDADAFSAFSAGRSSRLVLLGDSITESWRGTSYGRHVPRTAGVPAVLGETLARRWPAPLPLGIAADCTQHLLWRMQQGEFTAAMKAEPRLLVVLLIGTNNLGRGHSADETIRGVLACARHILNGTKAKLLVNALLPRGDKRKKGPLRGQGFMADLKLVNKGVNASIERNGGAGPSLAREFPGRVIRYVDCGGPFLNAEYRSKVTDESAAAPEIVDRALMPDRLHPNAAGHRLWASCLEAALCKMDPQACARL